jgi:hypothetical protein
MKAYYDLKYPTTLDHCCGIPQVGEFTRDKDVCSWREPDFVKIKDLRSFGCGIFVSTFLPSQAKAMSDCEKYHTLLFKTGPHKNMGPDATYEGREEGVYLCVFKFGKVK